MLSRIYADFNNCDADGRVRLNTVGSSTDIGRLTNELFDGMTVELYCDDLQATGVVRELAEGGWGAEIDWGAVRDM